MFDRIRGFAAVLVIAIAVGCSTPTDPPTYDTCPNIAGDQPSVPSGMVKDGSGNCVLEPEYNLSVTVISPTANSSFYVNQHVACDVKVYKNGVPVGMDEVEVTWLPVNGIEITCLDLGQGFELVTKTDSTPIAQAFGVGVYTLTLKACDKSVSLCVTSSVSSVEFKPEPDMIIFTKVEATYPNWGCTDVWGVDAVPGATPRRLTTGCNKGTFAVTRDGKTLWYTEAGTDKLWKSNLDGSNPVLVPTVWNGQSVANITYLRVSPDGSKISFTIIASDGNTRVLVMNADGTGLRSLFEPVYGVYTVGIGSAWMPDSRHIMAVRDSAGTIDNTFRTVQNQYIVLDLETGEEKTAYVSKYGEDQYGSILRGISDTGDWFLLQEIQTTSRATIIRTDGSGEIRPLTERDKNAADPIFCGEGFICALTPVTPSSWPVSRVGFDGKSETLFSVNDGWVAELAFLKGGL